MEAKYLFLSFIGFVWGDGLQYGEDFQSPVVTEEVYYEEPAVEYIYDDAQVVYTDNDLEPQARLEEKAADLTMFGETTGCGVNRDCLSCGNDRHKGCSWYANVGCVRSRQPFQCTANPFVPGEVKEQCVAFRDCKSCTTQAGCVFYKGSCTYSAGTNCLEDHMCINYPGQCPMVPLAVEARIFNGGGYNPVVPPVHSLNHPGQVVYQDISVMTDPYKNPLERQKRFHEDRMAYSTPPLPVYTNPNPPMSFPRHHNSRTYTPSIGRPHVVRSTPNVVHSFTPAGAIPSHYPTSRVFSGSSRSHGFGGHRSFGGRVSGGHGHYNRGHNQFGGGHHYGWN